VRVTIICILRHLLARSTLLAQHGARNMFVDDLCEQNMKLMLNLHTSKTRFMYFLPTDNSTKVKQIEFSMGNVQW